ncbi:MAG: DUF5024 domain-containing protein [Tannerellaceae bacterium]|jgi:hypothetical protein|nr:DUF5024 domain-containing protein [Tannerellaceae bacterium]
MKTKHLFLVVILLFTGSMASEIQAQSNIKALFRKCEAMDDVEMSRIRNRDEGKEKTITGVTFKNNEQLLKEFQDACKKDEGEARFISEEKVDGKMVPKFYRFDNATFSYDVNKDGNGQTTVSATLIEN